MLDHDAQMLESRFRGREIDHDLSPFHGGGEIIPNDDADVAAQHLGPVSRQMELLLAEVHPHILETNHHVGVAGETHPNKIEKGGKLLVRRLHVDVLEQHDVANVLGDVSFAGRTLDSLCRH